MAEVEIKKQKENEVKLKVEIDKLKVNSYLDKKAKNHNSKLKTYFI